MEKGGIEAGEAAAQAMLDARAGDGFMAAFSPTIGTDAGDWRPIGWPATPAFDPDGWVGHLKPFVIKSPSQFRSDGPNALTSGGYAKDYNEVKELGALNSTKRTADQTTAAVFWQFPPAALYNRLARELSAPARYGLDTFKQARLYAMVNLAMADGATTAGTTSTTGRSGGRGWRSARARAMGMPRRSATRSGSRSSTRRRAPGSRRRPSPITLGARLRERRGRADVRSSSGRTRSRSTSTRAGSRTSRGTSTGSRSR